MLAPVLTEKYFLDLMKDLADENKVDKMAICLKVPQPILSNLQRRFSNDTPLLATKVCYKSSSSEQCVCVHA